MGGISEVDASGTCFGKPFTLDDIMVGLIDDAYVVAEDIPLMQQDDLFDAQPGWFDYANISIETGMKFNGTEFPWEDGWLLPPGEHTIVMPAEHYMITEQQERTITVDLFDVVEPAEDIDLSSAVVDETVEAFFAQCGDICTVTRPESRDTAAGPLKPVPVEVTADGSFTLARGDVAIIPPAPEVTAAGSVQWRTLWPGDWGGEDSAQDRARAQTPLGLGLGSLCDGSESCRLSVGEVEDSGVELDSFYLDEVDGDVNIVTLYGEEHLTPEEAPPGPATGIPTGREAGIEP